MENFRNKSFFVAFIVLWGGLVLWNLFTPAQEFSESENRFLKVFPKFTMDTLLNGKFMADVEVYLNDHFAGRPYWVSMQSMIEYGTGKREINDVYIGKFDDRVFLRSTGNIYAVPHGKTILFGDVAVPDMDLTAKNIAGINKFAEQYGIPTYTMLIPSSTDAQKRTLPKFAEGWDEQSYISDVYAQLDADVTNVDAYEWLGIYKGHPYFEYIYYRTDHHWTSYGAFLGYRGLSQAMELPNATVSLDPDGFEVTEISSEFYGTFHSKIGFPLATPDIMRVFQRGTVKSYEIFDGKETTTRDSIYFDEFLDKKDKYSYFLGQVQPVVTIKTEAETDRKLIIFKDSYAHCLVPMMLEDFSEIRLIDLRFVNPLTISEQLEVENYSDALFLYSTDVFSHQLGAGILRT